MPPLFVFKRKILQATGHHLNISPRNFTALTSRTQTAYDPNLSKWLNEAPKRIHFQCGSLSKWLNEAPNEYFSYAVSAYYVLKLDTLNILKLQEIPSWVSFKMAA